jgi:serine/threonine protein kinase
LKALKFLYVASEGVKAHRRLSQRLKERVKRLEEPLHNKASAVPEFAAAATELLNQIAKFLAQHKEKKPILRFVFYQQIIADFDDFGKRLSELVGDVQFAGEIDRAEQRQVELDDFDEQQSTNRDLLPLAEAEQANKCLQLEAPKEFTGFVEIDSKDFQQGAKLGAGSLGIVYRSKWKGMEVAVKVANCTSLEELIIKQLRRELRIHAAPQARHECIVALYGASTVHPLFALLMELAPYGTLYDLLHSIKDCHAEQRLKLTLIIMVQMLRDAASALHHLHKHNIVHGDVKTSNALVFDGNRIKICDFGLAKVSSSVASSAGDHTQSRGTPAYMAPEVLNGSSVTAESDVYSFSMMMYEVMFGIVPFAETAIHALHYQLSQGRRPDITGTLTDSGCALLIPLLQQCWQEEPNQRPN